MLEHVASSAATVGAVVGAIGGVLFVVLVVLVLLRRRQSQVKPGANNAVALGNVAMASNSHYAGAGPAASNPMYGLMPGSGSEAAYATVQPVTEATYSGIAEPRDGGYMSVTRPAAPGSAINPLYDMSNPTGNYGDAPSRAAFGSNAGQDTRNFSIEKGRLRLASVSRVNPLTGFPDDESFSNPMYNQAAGNNSKGIYDDASAMGAPTAFNPLYLHASKQTESGYNAPAELESSTDVDYLTCGEASSNLNGSHQYDAAGSSRGPNVYDAAGKNVDHSYDAAGNNRANTYDAAGNSRANTYDAAGNTRTNTYDAAGNSRGNAYDAAGRMDFGNTYDAAGNNRANTYDAAGNSRTNAYDAAGNMSGPDMYDAVANSRANTYDAAGNSRSPNVYDAAASGRQQNNYDQAGSSKPQNLYDVASSQNLPGIYDSKPSQGELTLLNG